jgi:hypothetical protein
MTRSRDTASIIPTVDAKGDLLVGTADNTIDNLSPGTNGQVLTANSATGTGLEWITSVPVASGGTGATTLASGGYLKGAGTSAVTSQTGVPAADVTGTVAVGNGGTGATTLASGGYLKGAGASAITSQSGIPAGDITSGTISDARLPAFGSQLIASQSFSAQNSIIFNNVFSSLYDSYQIITNLTASSGGHDPAFTLRVGGVNASTNYQVAYIQTKSAAVNGFENLSGAAAQMGRFDAAGGLSVMTIHNPAVAARTFAVIQSIDSSMFSRNTTWMHTTATAYDGVEFGFSSGTGTIRIYGIRKS